MDTQETTRTTYTESQSKNNNSSTFYRWALGLLITVIIFVLGGLGGRITVSTEAHQALEKVNIIEGVYGNRLDTIDKNLVDIKYMMKEYHDDNRELINRLSDYVINKKK